MDQDEPGQALLALVEMTLARYPHLEVVRQEGLIIVKSKQENGFDVEAEDDGDATVFAGPWHNHFFDPNEAAAAFFWLLTKWARIRVVERGGKCIEARAELFVNSTWNHQEAVGALVPPEGDEVVRYLQNDLIDIGPP